MSQDRASGPTGDNGEVCEVIIYFQKDNIIETVPSSKSIEYNMSVRQKIPIYSLPKPTNVEGFLGWKFMPQNPSTSVQFDNDFANEIFTTGNILSFTVYDYQDITIYAYPVWIESGLHIEFEWIDF